MESGLPLHRLGSTWLNPGLRSKERDGPLGSKGYSGSTGPLCISRKRQIWTGGCFPLDGITVPRPLRDDAGEFPE